METVSEIIIRNATKDDIPFLAEIILLAETSGKELISYKEMFPFTKQELLKKFEKALDNEQLGHGLTYKTFVIAELKGKKGAAACGYIEGEFGSSNHLMTGALINAFGMSTVLEGYEKNAKFKDVQINKTAGTLQIDSVATLPEFRGKGLFKQVFDKHCKMANAKNCNQLEIQVWAGNEAALSTYRKLGCELSAEKFMNNDPASAQGRVLMSKRIINR
jgi:ribosomal protein S18 acetylase RimI-like enzyme